MIAYRWFKVFAIWEDGKELDFIISGVDENSVGQTASKLQGIREIKQIRLATKEEIKHDS